MRNWIFTYEHNDHEHAQTLVVNADTGRVDHVAFTVWAETIRPRRRLTRRDVALAA